MIRPIDMQKRIVFVSDTHLGHDDRPDVFPALPAGDILVHAGDATYMGTAPEITQFANWFCAQPFKTKVFVPGNHDWGFEKHPELFRNFLQEKDVHVLIDEAIELEGIKFYGSPFSPRFGNWAFALNAGQHQIDTWAKIPNDTDILITHGPPLWIGDRVYRGDHVGCDELYRRVMTIKPKIHVFGHIHESYGAYLANGEIMKKPAVREGKTLFLNAAICDLSYDPINKPMEIIYG